MNPDITKKLWNELSPCQNKLEWFTYLDFVGTYFQYHNIGNPIVVEIGIGRNAQKPFYELELKGRHIGIDIACEVTAPNIMGDSHAPATLHKLVAMLGGRNVDLLFIDGDHAYESVKKDYEIFSPLTKGLIAFHDIAGVAGPKQLWQELIINTPHTKYFISIDARGSDRMGIGIMAEP